jgi:hypothetical protein
VLSSSSGTVGLGAASFSGGTVDFGYAEFSTGTVRFGSANFCGTVDFSRTIAWSVRPHSPGQARYPLT